MEHPASQQRQYLVQQFVGFDGKGDGAWLSLKLFQAKQEAEQYAASLAGAKTRIAEVLCEATK